MLKQIRRTIKQAWIAADLVLLGFERNHKKVVVYDLDGDEGRPDVRWLDYRAVGGDGATFDGSLYKAKCSKCEGWYEVPAYHAGVVAHFCQPKIGAE